MKKNAEDINKKFNELYVELQKNIYFNELENFLNVMDYKNLVTCGKWTEKWLNETGQIIQINVEKSVWSIAIQKALEKNKKVYIPYFDEPIYIDKPIILSSDCYLKVHPNTEIRLKPYTSTCMIRNENVLPGNDKDVEYNPDSNITIEGGIWTDLANGQKGRNGNFKGEADKEASIKGANGVILLSNIKNTKVFDVVIKECTPFGIQLSNIKDFIINNVTFINNRCDGVHVNGPATHGIIKNLKGNCKDDMIAFNAWDWESCTISFGSISDIFIQNIEGTLDEIRLLAGEKKFNNMLKVPCEIKRCIFENLKGIHNFKIYPQHAFSNTDDCSEKAGYLDDIHFNNVEISEYIKNSNHKAPKKGIFEIGSDIGVMSVKNLKLHFTLDNFDNDNFSIISVRPLSYTWKNSETPNFDEWFEIFDPDKDCTVSNLLMESILVKPEAKSEAFEKCTSKKYIAKAENQTINQDYPNTTPKGGIGKGEITNLIIK